MEKKFIKCYEKIMKGAEGYEGVSFENGRLVHSMELHVAELENVKIITFKKGEVVKKVSFGMNEPDANTPLLRILIKKYSEMFLSMDGGKTKFYFGDNLKYCNQEIDESLLYIKGEHGSYLLHGTEGQKLQYLSNIGTGDASAFMLKMFNSQIGKCGIDE